MSGMVEKALVFAKECHGGDNSGHDIAHILRVLANAERILAEIPAADAEAVRLAAVLHDVDDYKLSEDNGRAEKFLQEAGIDEALWEKVLAIIGAISFSKSGSKPHFSRIEQAIVSDADKLDAMGAIGVCRTVMYSAATGRALFEPTEFPAENLSAAAYKNKNRAGNHAINHFFDKLLRLKGAMQTDAGRREAEKRHRFMIAFLQEFFADVEAPEWQSYMDSYLKQI